MTDSSAVRFAESEAEQAALETLEDLGWVVMSGAELSDEREDIKDPLLRVRLSEAILRLNPFLRLNEASQVIETLLSAASQDLMAENLRVHKLITEGVPVEIPDGAGTRTVSARVVDWKDPYANDYVAVSQLTLAEDLDSARHRRPDITLFVNGLPLGMVEMKRPNMRGGLMAAWRQIDTYAERLVAFFTFNAVCVVADGINARMGTAQGAWEHWAPWKTIDGRTLPKDIREMDVLVRGVFHPERFCELVRDFIVFSAEQGGLVKRVAKYHQFHAVRKALESVRIAIKGTRRAGVVWHTQGSGKSLEMLFCTAKLMRDPELANPTIVIITDRNDLDDQLFSEVFSPARIQLLPETPQQAESRENLKILLSERDSGGIVFTTMQKFGVTKEERDAGRKHPVLTDRENVVVIADEAHRTQYGLKEGLAANLRNALPNASLLAFTGTPIEEADRDTRAVFGDYIDVYDLTQSVEDQATVPIYYDARLARIGLPDEAKEELDRGYAELTGGTEFELRERLKRRFSRVEELVGSPKRISQVVEHLLAHWEERSARIAGKGMVVCFSRRICVDLYEEIKRSRPGWCTDDDTSGAVKVVITGDASEGKRIARHLRTRGELRRLKERMKDPDDPLELVIVRDMWLTGFDAPPLHTMYVDKPMRGAGLMQAIARVNRIFRDKPSGLVVDYIGIAENLRSALNDYTPRDRQEADRPVEQARDLLQSCHERLVALLYGCPWRERLASGTATARLDAVHDAAEYLLSGGADMGDSGDVVARFRATAREADQLFCLMPQDDLARRLRDDLAFFDAVAGELRQVREIGTEGYGATVELALRQIVSEAIVPEGVVDIYTAAGLEKPDISILDDSFAERFRNSPRPNLQFEVVRRILRGEIRQIGKTSVIAERNFSQKLEEAIRKYNNRTITAAEVMAELVALAKSLTAERQRGADLGLTEAELAFYDAVSTNSSAALGMTDEVLRRIAKELVKTVNASKTIDWAKQETVRASLRRNIRRLLARFKYPPDRADLAVQLVVEQAERMAQTESEEEN
ncbi:type I restriction endonuclease subunit R [Streptomyces cellulosae]